MVNMNKIITTVAAASVCRMWNLMESLTASTNRVNFGILTPMPAKTSLNLGTTMTINKIRMPTAAPFSPVAGLIVVVGILVLLLVMGVPKFKEVFAGMGVRMPKFTLLVLAVSDAIRFHILQTLGAVTVVMILFMFAIKTKIGRYVWDKVKLKMPVLMANM